VETLQRWDKEGILIAHRSPTNRRYYTHAQYLDYRGMKATDDQKTVVYTRVSSQSQKPDLQNQREAIRLFCVQVGYEVDEWVDEIGSGLNYQRKQFNRLMQDIELGQVKRLIIAHKDRLVRFGFEWFAAFCERHGTHLLIVNGDSLSPEHELVQDLLSIVHVFSARLYGLRSYKQQIKEALAHDHDHPLPQDSFEPDA
jgi:predicted site-specific integrase-resolvase